MVPTIGVSKIGVKKAIPVTPNVCQTFTIRLFLVLKIEPAFFCCRLAYHLENALPISEKIITLVIMPAIVSIMVSTNDKPEVIPRTGPPKNFTILIR